VESIEHKAWYTRTPPPLHLCQGIVPACAEESSIRARIPRTSFDRGSCPNARTTAAMRKQVRLAAPPRRGGDDDGGNYVNLIFVGLSKNVNHAASHRGVFSASISKEAPRSLIWLPIISFLLAPVTEDRAPKRYCCCCCCCYY